MPRQGVVSAYLDALSAAATAVFLRFLSGTVSTGSWSGAWLQLAAVGALMTCSAGRFVWHLYNSQQEQYHELPTRDVDA
jgi:hypothetical protein